MIKLGRFEIIETLSKRNSVQTYKCEDAEFGPVVLKVFESPSDEQKSHLRQLSESLIRLSHPGLQTHLGYFEDHECVALVFGWVDGVTLAQEIEQRARYRDNELFACLEGLLQALAMAHGLTPALVHRDIKPENVVRTSSGWVLIDFGASREAWLGDGEVSVIGTTGYAAPEQFFGQALPASDQYGLAATILHLATHRHPTDFPLKKLQLDIDGARLHRPLKKILNRMLAPDPRERFPNVQAALDVIRSGDGMQEWELAFEPLSGAKTVLESRALDDTLEVIIGPRYYKGVLFLQASMPFGFALAMALVLMSKGFALTAILPVLGTVFGFVALFTFPIIRREWLATKTWNLSLSPHGWQLTSEGRTKAEGLRVPEIVTIGGFLQEMDSSLKKRTPVKLKHIDGVSPGFGYSMNAKEAEVLQDIVASYYRPYRPDRLEPFELPILETETALMVRASEFLQKSNKRPTPLRTLSSLVQVSRELPATPGREKHFGKVPKASQVLIQRSGFRKIGYLKETLLGVVGPAREVYLSEDGAVALHIAPGVFGASSSDFTYYMASLMDNGRYRLTWSHSNPTTPTGGLVYSAGSVGGFEKDLKAHRDWVQEQLTESGSRPVSMTTMEDRTAVLKHYHRHNEPMSSVFILLLMAFSILLMPIILFVTLVLPILF